MAPIPSPAEIGAGLPLAQGDAVLLGVDARSFLVIVAVAAVAALLAALLSRRLPLPVVVIEIALGILVGPEVAGLAEPDDFIGFFANLGLGMLFFFAGYEIDFARVRGAPLRLAAVGWLLSLALAYAIGGLLAVTGVVLSFVFVGSAIATTAIGTLIPMLRDAGELRTRFGSHILAAGALGEFGPILLVTLLLSTRNPASSALLLALFIALAVLAAVFAIKSVGRGFNVLEQTLESSGQLAVRLCVVMVFGLVALAAELGLDLLLGGFVAGIITRAALTGREVERFESKLVAVGYGFFIPFFFVVSGIRFDLGALVDSPASLLELPLFLGAMLVVRGAPALLLYRRHLDRRERRALAFLSATELPLVVAITTLAVDGGHMRGATAASLVGAAILSTMIFPLVGLRLRRADASAVAATP